MSKYQYNYQYLSRLVADLPEDISPTRYLAEYQAALRGGLITAAPLGTSFVSGANKVMDDLVRADDAFEAWHARTVRDLALTRTRRGVVVHEDAVRSGEADFDDLARRYREQLTARASVKRPNKTAKRRKPKLPPATLDAAPTEPGAPSVSDEAAES